MRIFEFRFAKYLCKLFDHRFDEFHIHEVVCSRCRICRAYTTIDEEKFDAKVVKEVIKWKKN